MMHSSSGLSLALWRGVDDNSVHIFEYFPVIQNHQAVLYVSLCSLMFLLAVNIIFPFYCFRIQQLHFSFRSAMLIPWLVL